MTVLSAQTIALLSNPPEWLADRKPLITPFRMRTPHSLSGMTGGLSACGYDLHIRDEMTLDPGGFSLAVTIERLCLPNTLVGILHDKSTLARLGIAVQNTVAEPGWEGWLTLEITNHSSLPVTIYEGQPIGQMLFHRLDGVTSMPYNGRYQNQGCDPQEPLFLSGDE